MCNAPNFVEDNKCQAATSDSSHAGSTQKTNPSDTTTIAPGNGWLTGHDAKLVDPCEGSITFYRYTSGSCKSNARAHISSAEECFEAATQYNMSVGIEKAFTLKSNSKPKGCYFDISEDKNRLKFNIGSDEDTPLLDSTGPGFCECSVIPVALPSNSNSEDSILSVPADTFRTLAIAAALVALAIAIACLLCCCRNCRCCWWYKKRMKQKRVVPAGTPPIPTDAETFAPPSKYGPKTRYVNVVNITNVTNVKNVSNINNVSNIKNIQNVQNIQNIQNLSPHLPDWLRNAPKSDDQIALEAADFQKLQNTQRARLKDKEDEVKKARRETEAAMQHFKKMQDDWQKQKLAEDRDRKRKDADAKAKQLAEQKAKERAERAKEADRKKRQEEARKAQKEIAQKLAEAQRKADEMAAALAAERASQKAKAEAERKAREKAENDRRRAEEQKAEEDAKKRRERRAKHAKDSRKEKARLRKAKEDAERRAKQEAERNARQAESARKAKEEADRKLAEADRIAKQAQQRALELAKMLEIQKAREAKLRAAQKEKEEATRKAKEVADRKADEEARRRAEQDRRANEALKRKLADAKLKANGLAAALKKAEIEDGKLRDELKKREEEENARRKKEEDEKRRIAILKSIDKDMQKELKLLGCTDVNVELSKGRVEILKPLMFEKSKTKLEPYSMKILNQLGKTLNALEKVAKRRGLPMARFLVEGHTNCADVKKRLNDYHVKLSNDRAHKIVKHLKKYNTCPREMLTPKGFGGSRRIYHEEHEDPRMRDVTLNQRVEFNLINANELTDGIHQVSHEDVANEYSKTKHVGDLHVDTGM